MNDNDTNKNLYQISYKDGDVKKQDKPFFDSAERAKSRFEKFKQEHENYTEIKIIEMPSLDVFRDTLPK